MKSRPPSHARGLNYFLPPSGMMLLSEEERLKTLKQLAESKKEVEAQLQRLPFNVETPSQIRHKQRCAPAGHAVCKACRRFASGSQPQLECTHDTNAGPLSEHS